MTKVDKLKVRGLGNLELVGGIPEVNKDYLLSLRVSRSGVEVDEQDSQNPVNVYVMKYLATELLQEINTRKEIKVEKGKTQSQKLRWTIYDLAVKLGKDENEFYKERMSEIIEVERQKLE